LSPLWPSKSPHPLGLLASTHPTHRWIEAKRGADRPTAVHIADRLRAVPPHQWDEFFRGSRAVRLLRAEPITSTSVDEAEPAGSELPWSVPSGSTLVRDATEAGHPGTEGWVQPRIHLLPKDRRPYPRVLARTIGVLGGLIFGMGIALVLLHR
jgi:hypothetical protein